MKYIKSFEYSNIKWDYMKRTDVPKLRKDTKENIVKALAELSKHENGMGLVEFVKLIVGDNYPNSKPTTVHYAPALTYMKNLGFITITPQEKKGKKTIIKITEKGKRVKPENITPELINKLEVNEAPDFYTVSIGQDGYCDYTSDAKFKTVEEAESFILNDLQFSIVKGTQMHGKRVGQIEEMYGDSEVTDIMIDKFDSFNPENKFKREQKLERILDGE